MDKFIDFLEKLVARVSKIDVIKTTVAMSLQLSFGYTAFALISHEVPAGNKDAILILFGALANAYLALTSYYFGSSLGSKQKSETIDKKINETK